MVTTGHSGAEIPRFQQLDLLVDVGDNIGLSFCGPRSANLMCLFAPNSPSEAGFLLVHVEMNKETGR